MGRCRALLSAMLAALAVLPLSARDALTQGARPADVAAAPAGESDRLETRAFTIRYKDIDDAYVLISPYLGARGSIRIQPRQRILTVLDDAVSLERIAGIVAAYDVPPRNVEVSVQLILASAGGGSPEPAPPPIRGVIDKLNALSTRWSDYRLVGNARVLGVEGETSKLRVGDDYRIDFRIDQVSDETRVIRFKPFELQRRELTVEGNERYTSILNTVLNLRDAQQFIVGASKIERSNRALFMTITASLQQP